MRQRMIYTAVCILVTAINGCGPIIPGTSGSYDELISSARKNVVRAESLEDPKQRERLLSTASSQLNSARNIASEKKLPTGELSAVFAYYHFVEGNYGEARTSIDMARNGNYSGVFLEVLEVRINLREKGKSYAGEAVTTLEQLAAKSPRDAMIQLVLGDSKFMLSNFDAAVSHYKKVLTINTAYQVEAADRLETLSALNSLKIDIRQVKDLTLSKTVRRDELANLLYNVYNVSRYIRASSGESEEFNDISKSIYTDAITDLRRMGFFSFIEGKSFYPFEIITRRQMAYVIEDFIVLATGNTGYRNRYTGEEKSPIKDVSVKDDAYNALRLAMEKGIMDPSLSGDMYPNDALSGLQTLLTLNKMMQNYRR